MVSFDVESLFTNKLTTTLDILSDHAILAPPLPSLLTYRYG